MVASLVVLLTHRPGEQTSLLIVPALLRLASMKANTYPLRWQLVPIQGSPRNIPPYFPPSRMVTGPWVGKPLPPSAILPPSTSMFAPLQLGVVTGALPSYTPELQRLYPFVVGVGLRLEWSQPRNLTMVFILRVLGEHIQAYVQVARPQVGVPQQVPTTSPF